jgi:hypothetical protein
MTGMGMRVFEAGGTGGPGRRLVPRPLAHGHLMPVMGEARSGTTGRPGVHGVESVGRDAVSVGAA